MASTYVNDLRLNELATGDASGTWGDITNTNLELIGEALSFGTEAITTNADTHTTTVADGASDPGRAMYLKYTGTLDSTCTITIAPNTMSRMQFIENGTSGSQDIIISQGSGANVTIPAGDVKAVYLDGAGSGAAVVDAFTDLSLAGTTQMTGFSSSSASTITVTDNSDNLTLTSTDADANAGPNLRMYRNSGSPADSDLLGRIDFEGRNNNSQDVVYGSISSTIISAADGSEDGMLSIKTMHGGSEVKRIRLQTSEAVFNEDSNDIDFRVESNSNTHMLFVDAGNDRVGINASSPSTVLEVTGTGDAETGITATHSRSGVGYTINLNNTNNGANKGSGVKWSSGGFDTGAIITRSDAAAASGDAPAFMTFHTSADGTEDLNERMRIDSSGKVGIGTSPDFPLHVSSTGTVLGLNATSGAVSQRFNENGTARFFLSTLNGSNGLSFVNGDGTSERMRIDSSGNVGIGMTPTAILDVKSDGNTDAINLVHSGNTVQIVSLGQTADNSDGQIELRRNNGAVHARFRAHGSSSFTGGNLGIGTSSPAHQLDVRNSSGTDTDNFITVGNSDNSKFLGLYGGRLNNAFPTIYVDSTSSALRFAFADDTAFNGFSEKMRITSAGQLIIGDTSSIAASSLYGINDTNDCFIRTQNNSTGSNNPFAIFHANNTNQIGSIVCTNTATEYNTTSDYRLKENVQTLENGLERLNNLKPVKFNWKEDGTSSEGFIAHETQEVFPDAVSGEKDGEKMQGMDYGRITPLLVKAIQEQQEQIEQLKNQIDTLQ